MRLLKVEKYYPRSSLLKGLVKYFWVLKSDRQEQLDHKILPVNNIDIVFNFAAPMDSVSGGRSSAMPRCYFSGIRNQHYIFQQKGRLNTFGISFFPAGVYPLLKTPLAEFRNDLIDCKLALSGFVARVEQSLDPEGDARQQVKVLENTLALSIDPRLRPDQADSRLLRAFQAGEGALSIKSFCAKHGVHQRRLERLFRKYVGAGPKTFQRLSRFQAVLAKLLGNDFRDLTSLAHESNFHDQAHFINDFKSFSGSAPKAFWAEKKAMMQILRS